ncbi:MAG: DegV family protein [Dehalococcoidia bacterium]|nr:DegV family protein [Dehalococcoidia bacterium]
MTVAVLADSSCAITPDLQEKFHMKIVPLHLMWDKEEYADWRDMTPDEFYARLKKETKNWPTSSGSVQGEFYNAIEELRGKFDAAVVITLSPNTPSAGYSSALRAKDMIEDFPVEVVDSNFVATGAGLVVTAAGRVAASGGTLEEVVQAARSVIPRVNLYYNVGSIEYFLKGGRVSSSDVGKHEDSYIIGSKDGKITPLEHYSTREEARQRIKELVREKARHDTPLHAAVFHGAARQEAEELKDWVASQYNCPELWIGELSPVVAIHMSPETLGIGFYNE